MICIARTRRIFGRERIAPSSFEMASWYSSTISRASSTTRSSMLSTSNDGSAVRRRIVSRIRSRSLIGSKRVEPLSAWI